MNNQKKPQDRNISGQKDKNKGQGSKQPQKQPMNQGWEKNRSDFDRTEKNESERVGLENQA